ncbi:MAG: TIR domain-containing protein [Dehalococcoidia bacterium]|nr:TIR domain-containing protein [Dehalococcoidia bacterium]
MKVFLNWSGEQSKSVALGIRSWLPDVLQAVTPWVSASDIGAGARWNRDIDRELGETTFGILCLTRDNMTAPWLLFEAGALAKTIEQARVCPYLLGIEPSDIPAGPLTQFQAKRANRTETFELVQAINTALSERALTTAALERTFDLWWPRLEQVLAEARTLSAAPATIRSLPDMVMEVLTEVRSISRRLPQSGAPPRGQGMTEEQKRMHSRVQEVRQAVFQDPMIKERGITESVIGWSDDLVTLTCHSPRGEVRGKVDLDHWDRCDGEEFTRLVVAPIKERLAADFDAKPKPSPPSS